MLFANEFKLYLRRIKEKIISFQKDVDLVNYLENYKLDKDLSKIEELIMQTDYKVANVGLSKERFMKYFDYIDSIDYKHILDDHPYYTMGVFFLPKNTVMPIHDHKNMMVFTKMLCGKAEIKSYDKINNSDLKESIFEVKHTQSTIMNEGDLSILTPNLKNLHTIIAQEHSAFLDIIIPDYTADNCCSYYSLKNQNGKLFMKLENQLI